MRGRLRSNCPVNTDARASTAPCKGSRARAGYWERQAYNRRMPPLPIRQVARIIVLDRERNVLLVRYEDASLALVSKTKSATTWLLR
jgi:hypothetical protein